MPVYACVYPQLMSREGRKDAECARVKSIDEVDPIQYN